MDQDSQLELTLECAATDGIAYFKGSNGKEYFRPGGGKPIRALDNGHHEHPMMYQFSRVHPLAESGRKFSTPREAEHYVGALSDFEMMLLLISATFNAPELEKFKERVRKTILEEQERMKRDNLAVLDTVPGFNLVRKYLYMSADDIYADLESRRESNDNKVSPR